MAHVTPAADETAIRRIIDERTRALKAKDAAAVVKLGAADIIVFGLAPPLQTPTGGTAGLRAWFDTWKGPIGYEVTQLDIVADTGVAFAHSISHMSGAKTDGAKPDLWFRETLGFRKVAGQWIIVHLHQSVPFHMDGSFKAAIDLQP